MANVDVAWAARLARYKGPELKRSVWQLATAAALFAAAWVLMYASLRVGYWLTLLLAVPAAFFLIRLFIIQHDCGHAAFFRSTRAADIVGSILGVLTLTPYHYWKKTHALHHATSGNLEHRGFGDIDTLTVDEYLARSRWERFKYRVYRHPAVLFGVGAVLHFFVRHRIPTIVPREWTRERRSIFWTDVGLAAAIALMGTLVGFREFALVQLPVTLLSTSLGVWLFYVQHQFEPTYCEHDERWAYDAAAAALRTTAPHPARAAVPVGRDSEYSNSAAPANEPRNAPITLPTIGTGTPSTAPTIPPTRAPHADRRDPPNVRVSRNPSHHSTISPRKARPNTVPMVATPTERKSVSQP